MSLPPNQSLYLTNLPDKLLKRDLRLSLYTLFSTYGVVLDVVALKTPKCRGQAHVVFRDIAAATQAMRALQAFVFFGKPMRIFYAKGKSHKISKLDGTFRIPTSQQAEDGGGEKAAFVALPGAETAETGEKREREESDDEMEMEMEEDDD